MGKEKGNIIKARTHRMSQSLYERVEVEANKSGNSTSNEINSLILDGLRFRTAKVVIQIQE